MNNQNNGERNLNRTILVTLVLFFAILLRDATTGTLSSNWVTLALMGATVIALPLLAKLHPLKKNGGTLNDR